MAESIFHLLKRERIKRKIDSTRHAARSDVSNHTENFTTVAEIWLQQPADTGKVLKRLPRPAGSFQFNGGGCQALLRGESDKTIDPTIKDIVDMHVRCITSCLNYVDDFWHRREDC